ncbi:hypothetical protein AAFF_G00226900 [Aldrovandia affinis]|uniref:Uncharacterized protein n=1 Tax=Aldrovandia affinis TaxID=143900 RepID=A0AAD7TBZ2_9TELE|nr:hypothetical protein AAFF_G00226900 [Aldrovandia affinis]
MHLSRIGRYYLNGPGSVSLQDEGYQSSVRDEPLLISASVPAVLQSEQPKGGLSRHDDRDNRYHQSSALYRLIAKLQCGLQWTSAHSCLRDFLYPPHRGLLGVGVRPGKGGRVAAACPGFSRLLVKGGKGCSLRPCPPRGGDLPP